jgi:hypothetical protein
MRKLDRLYVELRAARTRTRTVLQEHEQQERGAYGSALYRIWFATHVRLRGRLLGLDTAVRHLDPHLLAHTGPWRRKAHAALNEAFCSLVTRAQPHDVLEIEMRAYQAEGVADAIAAVGAGIEGDMHALRAVHELVERRAGAGRRRRGRDDGVRLS